MSGVSARVSGKPKNVLLTFLCRIERYSESNGADDQKGAASSSVPAKQAVGKPMDNVSSNGK